MVAAHGLQAPGDDPENTFYASYPFSFPVLNNSGDIAFSAATHAYRGVWREQNGNLSLVERSGGPAPGDLLGRTITDLTPPILNNLGQTLFGSLVGDPLPYSSAELGAIYLAEPTGAVQRVIGPGDQLETDRGTRTVTGVGGYGINNQGNILIGAGIENVESAILLITNDGIETVAAVNDSLGAEDIFYFNGSALSDNQTVAYEAALIGGDAVPNQTFVIVKKRPNEPPTIIARTETIAVGAAPGEQPLSYGRFGALAINGAGQVAFSAPLEDPLTGEVLAKGIWAQDKQGQLRLVTKGGQQIDVDNGPGIDLRTIIQYPFAPYGPMLAGFNDQGEVLFSVNFTDGSSGLFISRVAAIPETSTVILAVTGAVVCFWRMRRPRS